MKHLRLFETETDYDSEVSEFEYPTVSLVQDVEDVRYMTLRDKYTREYLTFEALEAGTFTLSIPADVNSTYMTSVSYSTDNGTTWTTTQVDNTAQTITTPAVNAGDKVLWKGIGKQTSSSTSYYSVFNSTGNFIVNGNIMSLLYGDNFINQTTFQNGTDSNFYSLFMGVSKLIGAENLILPAVTLTLNCYNSLFNGCTSLIKIPVLSAITLGSQCCTGMFSGCTSLTTIPSGLLPSNTAKQYCYSGMFYGCTSLTTIPSDLLPATTLADYCYYGMFQGCTALTEAPELPATTLASHCYQNMFTGCTALTTAPELPATILATYCYQDMFRDCTSLTTAPELPATTLANQCYYDMLGGTNVLPDCTNIDFTSSTVVNSGGLRGLFSDTKVTYNDLMDILPLDTNNKPCLPATTLASSCYSNMFRDCKTLTTPPELPATTLASGCYTNMFRGCTSLTTAPVLSATTLVSNCYSYMFYGCTNLNYIKAMFTTEPTTSYTRSWVQSVASRGTFVKNSAATWTTTGANGVPSGWTVETANA